MNKAVIVSAIRTAVGSYGGQWSSLAPEKLAAEVIREAVARACIPAEEIEDVIMGNLYGQHGNIARVASLEAGLPFGSGAVVVDRQCGSSLQAIYEAAMHIMIGNGDIYVACGLEHMTREPWQLEKTSTPYQRVGPACLETRLTPDAFGNDRMGVTAENVAARYGMTREELDAFALASHHKAAKATEEGKFKSQILPIEVQLGKGKTATPVRDASIRVGLTMDQLNKLRPIFKPEGMVTAGNSCPWSDGASALVLTSETRAKNLGLKPLATVKSFAVAGVDPRFMGIGPIRAVPKALQRAGITVADLDWIELNEAFAAQAVPCIRELGFPEGKVNPYGGGIALGHPLGATGAILTTKAVYGMQEHNLTHGLITMCIGGGQGAAMVIEREV